jgi:hypothetical protein
MSVEVMELFNIFSKTFSKEDAQTAVKDIETLISDHKRELSTKEDIQRLDTRFSEVELKLTKEIEQVRGEIKEVELRLTKEIEQVKSSTIKWVVGWMVTLVIAQTGAITAIFMLLK